MWKQHAQKSTDSPNFLTTFAGWDLCGVLGEGWGWRAQLGDPRRWRAEFQAPNMNNNNSSSSSSNNSTSYHRPAPPHKITRAASAAAWFPCGRAWKTAEWGGLAMVCNWIDVRPFSGDLGRFFLKVLLVNELLDVHDHNYENRSRQILKGICVAGSFSVQTSSERSETWQVEIRGLRHEGTVLFWEDLLYLKELGRAAERWSCHEGKVWIHDIKSMKWVSFGPIC